MSDLDETLAALARKSDARLADIERREAALKTQEAEQAETRATIDAETKRLAERLAVVNRAEAELAAKIEAARGEFATLAKARAAADAARSEYERLVAKIREISTDGY